MHFFLKMKVYLAHVYLLCNLYIQKPHVFTIIEAAETLFKRNKKQIQTHFTSIQRQILFLEAHFIVHSSSVLSCYLYWHVSSAGCSFVLYCVNVLTYAKNILSFHDQQSRYSDIFKISLKITFSAKQ